MSKTFKEIISDHFPASGMRALSRIMDRQEAAEGPGPHFVAPLRSSLIAHLADLPISMVRARPMREPDLDVLAFVPPSMLAAVKLSLPGNPDLLRRQIAVPAVTTSREERRLAQRRAARGKVDEERLASVSAVRACLAAGGLWRREDIASETGVPANRVGHVLDELSRTGKAIHVALGHWRSRLRSTDLVANGRLPEAKVLGCLLVGIALSVDEAAEMAGIGRAEAAAALVRLRSEGFSEPVGNRHRCPYARIDGLVALTGHSSLTPLGERILDAIDIGEPPRKIEIAARLSMGRGSVNRSVDRLVEEGWLSRVGEDRYAVA